MLEDFLHAVQDKLNYIMKFPIKLLLTFIFMKIYQLKEFVGKNDLTKRFKIKKTSGDYIYFYLNEHKEYYWNPDSLFFIGHGKVEPNDIYNINLKAFFLLFTELLSYYFLLKKRKKNEKQSKKEEKKLKKEMERKKKNLISEKIINAKIIEEKETGSLTLPK